MHWPEHVGDIEGVATVSWVAEIGFEERLGIAALQFDYPFSLRLIHLLT
jgi:hypothetical protein